MSDQPARSSYFITGGFGFLGQHIVQAIHDHDPQAELRLLVRTPRRTALGIENLEQVRLVRGELTQPETYAPALDEAQTVIHAAALVSFKPTDQDALYRSNVDGTRLLLEAALARACSNFIYISSISTIVRRQGQLTDETLVPDLESKRLGDPYGYTKRMGEIAIQEQAKRMRAIILNPSVIVGPGDRRVATGLRTWRWLRWFMPVLPMLPTLNSIVDVRDVARAVVLALTRGQSGERYIVTAHNLPMAELARLALQAIGTPRRVVTLSPAALRRLDRFLALLTRLRLNPGMRPLAALNVDKVYSTEKIRRDLGWAPSFSLEQTLRDALGTTGTVPRS